MPHAGALVRVKNYKAAYTVVSGVPFIHSNLMWSLTIRNEQAAIIVPIVNISPWYVDEVKDEACYTEEQIREAFREAIGIFINRLKMDCDE